VDWAHSRLGHIAVRVGNLTEAHQILAETTRNFHRNENKIGLVFTLEDMVSLNVLTGEPERAARLIGWANATREQIGDVRWRVEQSDVDHDIAAITARIGNVAFEAAYAAGQKMSLNEAIAFALNEI